MVTPIPPLRQVITNVAQALEQFRAALRAHDFVLPEPS